MQMNAGECGGLRQSRTRGAASLAKPQSLPRLLQGGEASRHRWSLHLAAGKPNCETGRRGDGSEEN